MAAYRISRARTGRAYPLLIGLATLGLVGYFGPWVPHRAAGLVITGLDLGEYVKFVPQVISGQIPIRREIFYFPLFAGSLIASLFAARRGLPHGLRALLALAAIPLALAMLPPAWDPGRLQLPEYRLQVIGIAFCLIFMPLAQWLFRRTPRRAELTLAALLALVAAVAPVTEFLRAQTAVAEIYNATLPFGWGFWAHTFGFASFALIAVATALRGRLPY